MNVLAVSALAAERVTRLTVVSVEFLKANCEHCGYAEITRLAAPHFVDNVSGQLS